MSPAAKLDEIKEKFEDVIEVAKVGIAVITIVAFIKKRIDQGPKPIAYGDMDEHGVENLLVQFGSDAVYNVTIQENTK